MPHRFLQLCKRLLAVLTLNDVVILTLMVYRSFSIYLQRAQCTCDPPIHLWLLGHFGIVIILRSCHLVCWVFSNHPQSEGFLSLFGTAAQRILSLVVLLVGFPIFIISTCLGTFWFLKMLDGRIKYCFPKSDYFTISTPWMIAFTLILSFLWIFVYFFHFFVYLPLIRIYFRYLWRGESLLYVEYPHSEAFIPLLERDISEHTMGMHQAVINTLPRVKISANVRRFFSKKGPPSLLDTIDVITEDPSTLPTVEPSDSLPTMADEPIICTICIEEMVDGQTALRLPCNHLFHLQCAEPWLINRLNCPNCQLYVTQSRTPLLYSAVISPTLEVRNV
ncbi:putative E3 ubiquitin-protein ligase RING1 [Cardiosporidium cionae]|uniref:E3 ubiquitin-protein ligase RING1 n=1 Tax=Cardiosporidium cionae TaxID=476202 RepID=A0ABQ7J6Y1_9APIC|nr:putative E3 ubiquitin-protein ligase RING1 [Cardiosporidium cionae]|eukprot:KAF8819736.1 putative E3 ubiquitin-protein ligase RING1 [Cardiosporidium cionae]